jgi:hypothetical protein
MKHLLKTVLGVLIFIALTINGRAANAQLRLRIDVVGGTGVTVTDNGTGDSNPVVGALTFTGALGSGFTVNVTTGTSKPVIGGGMTLAALDLNSVNVQTTGAAQLQVMLEDTGYVAGPNGVLTLEANIGGTLTTPAGSTATFQSWVDPTNSVPAFGPDGPAMGGFGAVLPLATSIQACSPAFTGGTGAFSATCSTTFAKAGTYSIFSRVLVSLTDVGSISFDQEETVPDLPNGAGCTDGTDCLSGFCTDDVCCDTACDGLEQACNAPESLGTCKQFGLKAPLMSRFALLLMIVALSALGVLAIVRRQRQAG